jgi:hypothetical protein
MLTIRRLAWVLLFGLLLQPIARLNSQDSQDHYGVVTREVTYQTGDGVNAKAEPAFSFSLRSLDSSAAWSPAAQNLAKRLSQPTSSASPETYTVEWGKNQVTFRSQGSDVELGEARAQELALVGHGMEVVSVFMGPGARAAIKAGTWAAEWKVTEEKMKEYEGQARLYVVRSDGSVRLTPYGTLPQNLGSYIYRDLYLPGRPSFVAQYLVRRLVPVLGAAVFPNAEIPLAIGELFSTYAEYLSDMNRDSHSGGGTSLSFYHPMLGWMQTPSMTSLTPYVPAPGVMDFPATPVQQLLEVPMPVPVQEVLRALPTENVAARVVQVAPNQIVVYPAPSRGSEFSHSAGPSSSASSSSPTSSSSTSSSTTSSQSHSVQLPKSVTLTSGFGGFIINR